MRLSDNPQASDVAVAVYRSMSGRERRRERGRGRKGNANRKERKAWKFWRDRNFVLRTRTEKICSLDHKTLMLVVFPSKKIAITGSISTQISILWRSIRLIVEKLFFWKSNNSVCMSDSLNLINSCCFHQNHWKFISDHHFIAISLVLCFYLFNETIKRWLFVVVEWSVPKRTARTALVYSFHLLMHIT